LRKSVKVLLAKKILKEVSLSINAGEIICIIGPSGSGKTTLLRTLNFLEPADSGQ
jgi:L-cystine transport system ATP-binding protein